jgi:uncharacterized membrane protein YkvA (DUF1232 family)
VQALRQTIAGWKSRLEHALQDVEVFTVAVADPRTPTAAKLIVWLIVAYAASPIDLIPDFLPVVGYLDDLILLPLGLMLIRRMIPDEVMAEARMQTLSGSSSRESRRVGAVLVVLTWVVCGFFLFFLLRRLAPTS